MDDIITYIEDQPRQQMQIMMLLHSYISSLPNIQAKIRYKIPFYFQNSWICYLNPVKGGDVELAFLRGRELVDEGGLLSANGRKMVKGVTYQNVEDVSFESLEPVLLEALILDENVPYSVKKKK